MYVHCALLWDLRSNLAVIERWPLYAGYSIHCTLLWDLRSNLAAIEVALIHRLYCTLYTPLGLSNLAATEGGLPNSDHYTQMPLYLKEYVIKGILLLFLWFNVTKTP